MVTNQRMTIRVCAKARAVLAAILGAVAVLGAVLGMFATRATDRLVGAAFVIGAALAYLHFSRQKIIIEKRELAYLRPFFPDRRMETAHIARACRIRVGHGGARQTRIRFSRPGYAHIDIPEKLFSREDWKCLLGEVARESAASAPGLPKF